MGLIAAVIIYGVVSTTMGYEEDVNKKWQSLLNYEADIIKSLGTMETIHG